VLHSICVKKKRTIHNRSLPVQHKTLAAFFNQYLPADQRVVDCLVYILFSVIRARTVNLDEMALTYAAPLGVKKDSLVRRFQRFFLRSCLSAGRVGAITIALLSPGPVVISIDRTNWKFGKTHVNLLIAGVCFYNVALPIAWTVLPASTKRGNSKTLHRKRIINQVLALLPTERIEAFVGDREFIGSKWISYLNKKSIPFVIRIRNTISVDGISAKEAIAKGLLSAKKRQNRKFHVCGVDVYITIKNLRYKRQKNGTYKREKLILISNKYSNERRMLGYYKQREAIEHLFSHWKKRGFDFESTHMVEDKKLEQWIGILTICVSVCLLWGAKREKEEPIRVKGHGFRAQSLFRRGLDEIREMLYYGQEKKEEWKCFITLVLKCLEHALP